MSRASHDFKSDGRVPADKVDVGVALHGDAESHTVISSLYTYNLHIRLPVYLAKPSDYLMYLAYRTVYVSIGLTVRSYFKRSIHYSVITLKHTITVAYKRSTICNTLRIKTLHSFGP